MAAKRITPDFRDKAVGEDYFEIDASFTGVAIGFAKIINTEPPAPQARTVTDEDLGTEIEHFWAAYAKTVQIFDDRLTIKDGETLSEEEALMNKTINRMVRGRATDDDISERTIEKIPSPFKRAIKDIAENKNTVECAVYSALGMVAIAQGEESPAGQEALNIRRVFLRQYNPNKYENPTKHLRNNEIPIYERISHGDVAELLDQNGDLKVKGAFVDDNTSLSHATLKAKSHNLLLVWSPDGQRPATIQDGSPIILDGDNKVMILGASDKTLKEYQQKVKKFDEGYATLQNKWKNQRKVKSRDEREFKNYVNADTPNSAKDVKKYAAQGIGLIRLEEYLGSLKKQNRILSVDDWYSYIEAMHKNSDRATFVFRLLDAVDDKAIEGFTPEVIAETDEKFITAFLKYRAANPTLNLELMPPNIKSADQLKTIQTLINQTAESLGVSPYKLGSMDEHPDFNAALKADHFLENEEPVLSFISVGSNDMTASTLGIDRFDKKDVAKNDNTHPDVLKNLHAPMLYQRDIGGPDILPVSNCGDMASQPDKLALLAGMGYRRASMAAAMIPIMKELQSRIDTGYRFRALRTDDPNKYAQEVEKAQNNDYPSNAWALYQRIAIEDDAEIRKEILTEFNEKFLGLDSHNRINLKWMHPDDMAHEYEDPSPIQQ